MAKKKVHASRKASRKSSKQKHAKPSGKSRTRKSAAGVPNIAAMVACAIDNVQWVHITMERSIEGLPADKAMYQVAGTDNHLMWTVGHLATVYAWFASMLDGRAASLPETYYKLFGYKSKPSGDAAAYPSLDEVKGHYRAAYAQFVEAMTGLRPADMLKATVTDSHGFAKTRMDVLIRAAWHEGWHSGQLGSLRRALGLPTIM